MEKLWKQGLEGLIVTLLGVACVVGSIRLPDNPVRMEGWTGFVAQARFFPLLSGGVITILGVRLLVMQLRDADSGRFRYAISGKEWRTLLLCCLIVAAYLLGIYFAGFLVPTAVYLLVFLYILNRRTLHPAKILLIAAAYFVLCIYLTPMLLKINLP